MIDSMLMAFSLYSRIPVPQTKWNEKSMRWCICFLPSGRCRDRSGPMGSLYGADTFLIRQGFPGSGPDGIAEVLLSGGIHLAGYMDPCDAIPSYGSRDKRLEILKDPHVGAFAVIGAFVYFIFDFGIWSEAGKRGDASAVSAFRSLPRFPSAFATVTFPKAKKDGMLRQGDGSCGKSTAAVMAAVILALGAVMIPATLRLHFLCRHYPPCCRHGGPFFTLPAYGREKFRRNDRRPVRVVHPGLRAADRRRCDHSVQMSMIPGCVG